MDSKQVKERFGHYLLNPINEMSKIWFEKREKIKFHDPLAAVTIFNESVCSYKKGTVTIQREDDDFDGITIWEENSNGPHRIGSAVNVERFFESYFRVFQ
jgi:purine nucleosidase